MSSRFGGYSGFTWLNDFHSFNFDTGTWQAVPSGHKGSVPSTRFGYVSAVYLGAMSTCFPTRCPSRPGGTAISCTSSAATTAPRG